MVTFIHCLHKMAATILPIKMFSCEEDEGVGRRGRGGEEEKGLPILIWGVRLWHPSVLQDLCLCQHVKITWGSSAHPPHWRSPNVLCNERGREVYLLQVHSDLKSPFYHLPFLQPLSSRTISKSDESLWSLCSEVAKAMSPERWQAEKSCLKVPPSFWTHKKATRSVWHLSYFPALTEWQLESPVLKPPCDTRGKKCSLEELTSSSSSSTPSRPNLPAQRPRGRVLGPHDVCPIA